MSVTKVTVNGLDTSSDMVISGSTPTLTIGDAGAEDTSIVFDGNAKDFYVGLDDTADKLVIGEGSTVGTNSIITVTDDAVTIGDGAAVDTKIVFDGNAQDYYIGLDDTDDDLKIGLGSAVGTTAHMVFDEIGAITKPLQPCLLATIPSKLTNQGGSNTTTDVAWGTEIFDINSDFSTPSFTAPVTGKYLVLAYIGLDDIDKDATFYSLYVTASNRTLYFARYQPPYMQELDDASFHFEANTIIDMDASDTVKIQLYQADGASQTDIETASYLSICLLT